MSSVHEHLDPDALRDRYRAERDKRLRAEGNEQYVEIAGSFASYADDPYTEWTEREPSTAEVEVVIIGGGFGGLLAGARLREAGYAPSDICLIEKGGDVGGTWYWNRYPGAACDVESYVYLPLLEETGYIPVEKYSKAAEILEHSRRIARHFDLYEGALFQTEIRELRWDEASHRWTVSTNRGDAIRARFVVSASGPLHRPKLPGIKGIETFRGHTFHTSRWDYAYTGGDSKGSMTGLADKRVGIIGTGATAVQCVPHLGASAKELFVFQRTPSSIDVRNNQPTDPEWAASLQPGWQRQRMDNFNTLVSGGFAEVDLVNDGWTDIIGKLLVQARRGGLDMSPDGIARTIEMADFEKMNEVRARTDVVVKDKQTADALKPWYRQFCKRPCFHDEFLDTFNRPNVTLVDTDGKGVEAITEKGIVANGVEYELDCIIFGTGFEVGTGYSRRMGAEIVGVDGITLTEKWSDGMCTLHGMHVSSFPNLFLCSPAQSGFTVSYPHMLNEQAIHIGYILGELRSRGATRVEVADDAEAGWVKTIEELAISRLAFLDACTPGYYNNEGKPAERRNRDTSYGAGPIEFVKVLEQWRAEATLPGLLVE
jgi:cyclohexanone monooxygenase